MQRAVTYTIVGAILLVPYIVQAQFFGPLVPCSGVDCQACHLISLGQNILNFLISVAVFVAVIAFTWAGFLMVTAAGNTSQIEKARGVFSTVIIGFILVLAAWLIVNVILSTFTGSGLQIWTSQVSCVDLENLRNPTPGEGRVVVGGGTDAEIPENQIPGRIAGTEQYREELCALAAAEGVGGQCDHLQALMTIESNGNAGAVSPAGAIGLMQVLPSTARVLDPDLKELSHFEVVEKLKDPSYNMQLGVKLYSQDYARYNGDLTLVSAAYNGGRGANEPSRDCPGLRKWECPWDNPEHTVPNTGYIETRNYVVNVNNTYEKIAELSEPTL